MKKIKVNLEDRSYDIEVGYGFLNDLDFYEFKTDRCGIITDSNVKRLYGNSLQKRLQKNGFKAELFDFPAGEQSKTSETAINLGRKLANKRFDRDSMIIALGGGVVGDIAGFVASNYMRGVKYIQLPTTLVAQADSSIGGKTGVDLPEGKNLWGSFYQPEAVFTDTKLLDTLDKKEIKNGLAEIIKYGMIQDYGLFKYLEQNPDKNKEFYLETVETCCRIKAKIAGQDEKEGELRKILNYGHTVGHAIESAEKYKISHGEAVALGMIYEGKISFRLGLLGKEQLERQNKLIESLDLPTKYSGDVENLIEIMKRDKKNKSKGIYFVLPTKIGEVKTERGQIAFAVKDGLIKECLKN